MFDVNTVTTNTPQTTSPLSTLCPNNAKVVKLLTRKRRYISMLTHLTSLPEFDPNEDTNIIYDINECIDKLIANINKITNKILVIKRQSMNIQRELAYKYQCNVFIDFMLTGGNYGLSFMNRSYINGFVDFQDDDQRIDQLSDHDQKHYSTVADIFLSPMDLDSVANDKRIRIIADDIMTYIEHNAFTYAYLQMSSFVRNIYLKCIRVLVVCVPYHDMKNFDRFNSYFENVDNLVHHVLALFSQTFPSIFESTQNEWTIDNNIIQYDDNIITDEQRESLKYTTNAPQTESQYAYKYNIRLVMKDIYSTIRNLYGHHVDE